jgi:peptidoglycan/LPS O-acetylase OafA/YrhL
MQRVAYLDGLRGMAIIGVMMIHVGQLVHGLSPWFARFTAHGFRGVELFFIVSALTLSFAYRFRAFDPKSFYIRRFFRVAPMFYLAIIGYSLLAGAAEEYGRYTLIDVGLTLTFLHGLTFSSINSVVPGGWSIAAEALFYAIFPLLLAWLTTLNRSLVALGIATIVSFAGTKLLDDVAAPFSHFGFITNLPAFLLGIALFFLLRDKRIDLLDPRAAAAGLWVSVIALFMVGACNIGILRNGVTTSYILAAIVLFTALSGSRIFAGVGLSYLGKISFSLYLIHFAVLYFTKNLIALLPGPPEAVFLQYFLLVLGIGTFASTLTFHMIEQPMIRIGQQFSRRKAAMDISKPASSAI